MFQNKTPLLSVLIMLLMVTVLSGQDCRKTFAKVTAPSGLILRESPGSGYLGVIPLGDTISYCRDSTYGELSYEGISGFWRKVQYRGKVGFSFDGFLETVDLKLPSDSLIEASKVLVAKGDSILGLKADAKAEAKAEAHPYFKAYEFQFLVETYNYCGSVQDINLNLYWYGVFMDSELEPTGQLEVKPLNLNISLSKSKSGQGMEFDIQTDNEERSLFVFGLASSYPYQELSLADVMPSISAHNKRLFPGQEWIIDTESGLRLSATGTITKAGPCPEAENYQLQAVKGRGASKVEQDLKELIGDYGKCSIPEVYWYGDLSGDGLPEIIFVSVQDDQNVFSFLQSEAHSSQLFSLKSVFTVENCAK